MQIGSASPAPGETDSGYLEVTELPSGTPERVPVIVAEGSRDGPTLWVTGGVHGDEVTGMAVAQDVIHDALPERLAGTVVAVPIMSPAGMRRTERTSYYHDEDPNRKFPQGEDDDPHRPPKVQSLINERLYERITDTADALLDMHTAGVRSHPFTIVDRVLYGEDRDEARAEALADEVGELADAFGLPTMFEYEPEEYLEYNFERSNAGAVLNTGGIPSLTLELGSPEVVERDRRTRGLVGVSRVMESLDMLTEPEAVLSDGEEWIDPLPSPVSYPVRRHVGPHTDTAGVVRHRVEPGDVVEAGDPIADVVAPTGEHRRTVESDHDGWIVQVSHGFGVYENDPVATMAVREDDPVRVAKR